MCDFSCATQKYSKLHTRLKHQGEAIKFSLCDYNAKSFHLLSDHKMKQHDPTLKCPLCDHTGKIKALLKRHMLRHEDPKFLCKELRLEGAFCLMPLSW